MQNLKQACDNWLKVDINHAIIIIKKWEIDVHFSVNYEKVIQTCEIHIFHTYCEFEFTFLIDN